jgi:hypothetical protein
MPLDPLLVRAAARSTLGQKEAAFSLSGIGNSVVDWLTRDRQGPLQGMHFPLPGFKDVSPGPATSVVPGIGNWLGQTRVGGAINKALGPVPVPSGGLTMGRMTPERQAAFLRAAGSGLPMTLGFGVPGVPSHLAAAPIRWMMGKPMVNPEATGHLSQFMKTAEVSYRGQAFPDYNIPVPSSRPEKKKMVLVKRDDRVKLVHFGQKGYRHNYSDSAKKNYLSRSAGIRGKDGKPTASDPFSANYWARKELWPSGDADGKSATEKEASYHLDSPYLSYRPTKAVERLSNGDPRIISSSELGQDWARQAQKIPEAKRSRLVERFVHTPLLGAALGLSAASARGHSIGSSANTTAAALGAVGATGLRELLGRNRISGYNSKRKDILDAVSKIQSVPYWDDMAGAELIRDMRASYVPEIRRKGWSSSPVRAWYGLSNPKDAIQVVSGPGRDLRNYAWETNLGLARLSDVAAHDLDTPLVAGAPSNRLSGLRTLEKHVLRNPREFLPAVERLRNLARKSEEYTYDDGRMSLEEMEARSNASPIHDVTSGDYTSAGLNGFGRAVNKASKDLERRIAESRVPKSAHKEAALYTPLVAGAKTLGRSFQNNPIATTAGVGLGLYGASRIPATVRAYQTGEAEPPPVSPAGARAATVIARNVDPSTGAWKR